MKTANLLTLIVSISLIVAGLMSRASDAVPVQNGCSGAPYETCAITPDCNLYVVEYGARHCSDCDNDGVYHYLKRVTEVWQCQTPDGPRICEKSRIMYLEECDLAGTE